MKHILAATDGSPGADRAVEWAAKLAKALGASLTVLNVPEPPSRGAIDAFKAVEHVGEAEVVDLIAKGVLARAVERARQAGVTDLKAKAEGVDPAQTILEVAKRTQADAIVVGKRGRGPLAGLLLGTVSHKLVSLAPCSVVVVP
jgi:nucleotide-binding universal stress UspA family protein